MKLYILVFTLKIQIKKNIYTILVEQWNAVPCDITILSQTWSIHIKWHTVYYSHIYFNVDL